MEMREVGEEGLITSHHNCRTLLLAVPTDSGELVSSPDSLRSVLRLGTIVNPAQRISDHNRCLTLITMAPWFRVITNSHIPLATLQ